MHTKVIEVEELQDVVAVDVSPDSTRFATGTRAKEASVWSIATGQRLVGPLKHDVDVTGIRFSPSGEHIATVCPLRSISIFNSHTGDKLITIHTDTTGWSPSTPLAWSSDGQQIFTASYHNKIRAFDAFTGTQLTESQTLYADDNIRSIALATNGNFIATLAGDSFRVAFLDTLTLAHIGPVIENSEDISSISISPDSSRLATAGDRGKIVIRDLGNIFPELYGPFNVSIACLIAPVPSPTLTKHVGIYSRTRRAAFGIGLPRR